MSCIGWICLALPGSVPPWPFLHCLNLSCIGKICIAVAQYALQWLDLSCISWICLALARYILHYLDLSFRWRDLSCNLQDLSCGGGICLGLARSVLYWLDLVCIVFICCIVAVSMCFCRFSSEMYCSPVHLLALLFIDGILLGFLALVWIYNWCVCIYVCMYLLLISMNVGLFPKSDSYMYIIWAWLMTMWKLDHVMLLTLYLYDWISQ